MLVAPAALPVGVTAVFDAGTGTLTFTGSSLTAAQVQTLLQGVTYYDNSATPHTAPRVVTISVQDSSTGSTNTAAVVDLAVQSADDSPILNGNPVTVDATENVSTSPSAMAPSGAVGTLVSALIGNGNVTDPDGAGVINGATPGLLGIAITAADASLGTWWYSTNNGATWIEFAGGGNAIAAGSALHLVADANTRIYFAPTQQYQTGSVSDALTFRAWDQFDGVANGTVSLLPTDAPFGTGVNTEAAAYSSATQSISVMIQAVSQPVADGSATLASVSTDDSNPAGGTIASLFGSTYSDTANTTAGTVAAPLGGIAITGDAATAGQGVWQYSSDGGKTWTNVPTTSLSDANALVLSASDSLRFLPSGTFIGTPGALTTRLIAGIGVTDANGVDLTAAPAGASPYSAGTVTLGTGVVSVDNPRLSPPAQEIPDYNAPNDYSMYGAVSDLVPLDGSVPLGNPIFGYRPGPYDEPVIPQVWLVGSVGNRFVIETQQAVIAVPQDLFSDTWPNAELEYSAQGPGGIALPPWLTFDARNLTFSGRPPVDSHGTVEVEIIARDQFGNEAMARFEITVGREQNGLQRALEKFDAVHKTAHGAAGDAGHKTGQEAVAPARHAAGQAARHAGAHAPMAGRSAFSAQLRDAGRMGRLIEARNLVNTLAAPTLESAI